MRIEQLLRGSGAELQAGAATRDGPVGADAEIVALASDSRKIRPGALFAALPGSSADGTAFIAAAVAAGTRAILVGRTAEVAVPADVAVIRADDPRAALARIAANFYPRQPETIVAITGTNGKTSVAEFTRQIFAHLGRKAASLGTLGVVTGDGGAYGSLTTPDPITLHKTLDRLAGEGVTHLALEASSHGLDQRRLDGVRLTAGGFNNLGRDHLDYHATLDAYLDAKLLLFRRLLNAGQPAVINADGEASGDAHAAALARKLTIMGTGERGDALRLVSATRDGFEQRLVVRHAGQDYAVQLPLIGTYQASNALVAAAFAISCGEAPERAIAAIAHLTGVKGRLDIAGHHKGGIAIVDYAHKPEALEAALDALRPFATGNLICVFGCGGNRDAGKRPIMGEIAMRKADVVIVTDDNPRKEGPAAIRAEVLAGAKGAREIGDRAEAIRAGVAIVGPGDVLLVAGKGHEPGQIIGDVTHPFSDHDQIAAAIRETLS
jgi:UDP-N-acetylmuramoyl-L-alanyl-D-glutamate--2,6-diaminopimelate ligase